MSIIIKRLTLKKFKKDYKTPDVEDDFKIHTLTCDGKDTTAEDIASLAVNDKKDARATLVKFLTRAATGQLFSEVFTGKQFHAGHEFTYHGKNEKIWRLWLSGNIRIYFMFLPNRIIVILKTLTKREDDITEGEKTNLENITKNIIDCYESNLMTIIEDES